MSNEFNLEKAKAGEPIQYRAYLLCEWVDCHFVGESAEKGLLVIERKNEHGGSNVLYTTPGQLSMAPKKVTFQYRNYVVYSSMGRRKEVRALNRGEEYLTPEAFEKEYGGPIEWIHTEWQTAEIQP